jgi:flagellar motor switch protein FliM
MGLDSTSYAEFTSGLANPTCFNVLELSPGGDAATLELSPEFVFACLDRLLGGTGAPHVPGRMLTEVEREVISGISETALAGLSLMWRPQRPQPRFVIKSCDPNPYLSQPLPPGERVVVASYQVVVGGAQGSVKFACAGRLVDALLSPRATATSDAATPEPDSKSALRSALLRVPLDLSAELEPHSMSVSELIRLEAGDVLKLQIPNEIPAVLSLAGKPRLSGKLICRSQRRAVVVERSLKEETIT